ncbi:MAG TPA: hypothetical protein VKG38_04285 [Solirubrobacteraceae bacterium]|nr:hypothetical protein [Solirubrobacteraceae bacterium]
MPASLFGEAFVTAEDCITTAFSEGMQRISQAVLEAARNEDLWLERINAGLLALLRFLDDEPQWAHLLILERPFEGAAAAHCTRRVHSALAEVLAEARGEVVLGGKLEPPAELIAELLATAVFSVIRAQMLKGQGRPLAQLASSLMSFIVVPYLGRGAVRADRASSHPADEPAHSRPEVLPIRPHPRPVRALEVIASRPHLSSRELGIAVGIEEESGGQVAKLLKPLKQRGLIETASLNRRRAEPNAWLLTPYGRRALQLLSAGPFGASLGERRPTRSLQASHQAAPRGASPSAHPVGGRTG